MRHDGSVRKVWLLLLVAVPLALLLWWSGSTDVAPPGREAGPAPTSSSTALAAGLPAQVAETLDLVDAGGPFPYRRDGAVFMNREGRLPDRPPGYWREYTVPTPGEADRGARRLVVGRGGEVYYTDDHYGSFERIRAGDGS